MALKPCLLKYISGKIISKDRYNHILKANLKKTLYRKTNKNCSCNQTGCNLSINIILFQNYEQVIFINNILDTDAIHSCFNYQQLTNFKTFKN